MSVRTLFLVVFRPQSAAPPHWGLFIPDQPLIIQQFNHATPGKLIHIDGIPGVGFRPCASRGYVPARGRTAMHPFFIGQLAGQHVINGVPGSKGITAIDIIEDLAFKLPAMGSDPVMCQNWAQSVVQMLISKSILRPSPQIQMVFESARRGPF